MRVLNNLIFITWAFSYIISSFKVKILTVLNMGYLSIIELKEHSLIVSSSLIGLTIINFCSLVRKHF